LSIILIELTKPSSTAQAAPTWLDKTSMVLVRLLQTAIMLVLALHVVSWLSTSARVQVMRHSLAWPSWLQF